MPHLVSRAEVLMRQRLAALSRSLPGARKGDADQLHQARVATRRLREALPVVAPGARGRKLERLVRRLTRTLGPVRELDVALQTLDELAAAGDVPRPAVTTLRQFIGNERQRLRAEMRDCLAQVDLKKLQRRGDTAARADGAKKKRARDPGRVARAEARAGRRTERLRAAIENAAGIYLPDRLHDVRIAVKKLRYAQELLQDLIGSRATARLRTLKEAQDLLGRMNDLEVLTARIRAVQASSVPNLRLSADLDRLVRRLETECRHLHGLYMVSRRKLLAICDHMAARTKGGRTTSAA